MRAALIACPECDLLQRLPPPQTASRPHCARCGERLHGHDVANLQRDAALAVTALVLIVVANTCPLLVLELNGRRESSTVFDGVRAFLEQGRVELALVILVLAILAPMLHAVAVLVRSHLLARPRQRRWARNWALWSARLAPWGMTEVYLLGALVAFVKLDDLAEVVVGPALYAFAGMSLLTAWTSVHAGAVWARLREH